MRVPAGALLADGFDDCITGYEDGKVVYSYESCVKTLMKSNDWDYRDAIEWMEFNVVSAYMGERTPIFREESLGEDVCS